VPSRAAPMLRRALDAARGVRAVAQFGGEAIELTLHRLSADVAEGQSGVDAFFRAGAARLPVPGETLEVNVRLPPIAGAVLVPPDAMYGSDRVYLVRDDVLHSKRVRRLGQSRDADGRHLLILAGDDFERGDRILNSRLPQAVNGLTVEVAGAQTDDEQANDEAVDDKTIDDEAIDDTSANDETANDKTDDDAANDIAADDKTASNE
ncbi:MAG: hypothetical protein ACR2P7_08095, partial [bacterium]